VSLSSNGVACETPSRGTSPGVSFVAMLDAFGKQKASVSEAAA
jgi:hypothetical protein